MNEIYEPKLRRERKTVFTGGKTVVDELDPNDPELPDVVKAFAADDDLQEIRVCSANIGFIWTLSKQYRRREGVGRAASDSEPGHSPNAGTERRLPPPQTHESTQNANGGSRSLQ